MALHLYVISFYVKTYFNIDDNWCARL